MEKQGLLNGPGRYSVATQVPNKLINDSSYSTNFKSANREIFWTMVGTQNRNTKKTPSSFVSLSRK